MAEIMRRRDKALRDFRRKHRGEVVHLKRGAQITPVTATRARTEHDRVEEDGSVTRWISNDWIVPVSEYVFAGQAVEPEPGDRVIAVENLKHVTYEVVPAQGEHCWDWLNKSHGDYRVFSKRIATRS